MTSKQKIKAVIFDIGGVLQLGKDRKEGAHESVAKKLKVSLDQYYDSIDSNYAKSIEGKISEKQVKDLIARNLKTTPKKIESIYTKEYLRNFKINKELLRFSKKLKKKGFKIAILSDMWHIPKKALVVKEFYKTFNPVIVSCDVGTRKPNQDIFKLTLKKLNLKPFQTIFVDNQQWNIDAAKKIGMKTVLFKNNRQAVEEVEELIK